METETRLYEMSYLLRDDIGEEEILEKSESLRRTIENEGGLITHENKPKKQNLGYTVKKHDIAYFGSLKFIFSPEKIPALKKSFEKSDLLRLILSRSKHEGTFKKPVKKRAIRQLVHPTGELSAKEIQQIEGAQPKESVLPPALPNQGEPLQVEEIDKKLEEILGQ